LFYEFLKGVFDEKNFCTRYCYTINR
jgi:hypothetical protein